MLAERTKWSVMLRFKRTVLAAALMGAAIIAMPAFTSSSAMAAGEVTFASAQAAYDQGLGAVRAGKPELAVPAFEFAGEQNHVPALYFLGTIYANNDDRLTDHAKAFSAFHRIVERHAYVDPVSDFRSVYVVRAAVRLADYYRSGVPALKQKPDPRAAVELLNHAATYFGDLEAQFQLAKMHLTGEGVEGNERYGLHWLSRLAHKNHAGAQAFLAELMWRGKFVNKDPNQALVWSTLSVEAAGDQDRIWIEEVHQTIYCGAPAGVRERAGQLVADWRRRAPATTGSAAEAAHPAAPGRSMHVAQAAPATAVAAATIHAGAPAAVRTCANGDAVPTASIGLQVLPVPVDKGDPTANAPVPPPIPVIDKNAVRGSVGGQPIGLPSGFQGAPAATPAFTTGPAAAVAPGSAPFAQGFTEQGNTTPSARRR
jgi:TPR repeat protein